jgi:nicotinamide riboside transporter PnuC
MGAGQLTRLYGVATDDPNAVILLQHRALLFGLLGVLLIAAAFRSELRAVALVAGLVSTVSFLVIAWGVGGYNAQVARVVVADVLAVVLLLLAAAIEWRKSVVA